MFHYPICFVNRNSFIFWQQESDSNSDTTDSAPDRMPDYDSDTGCDQSRVEHSRTNSTSDVENYLGQRPPKIRKKLRRKRVRDRSDKTKVKSEKEEINVKAKLSPKIEEKNMSDLLETASKSDTSHDVEVDVTVISISSTEGCVDNSNIDPKVFVKEEPNTSSCSTPRVMNTYVTQQSTQNVNQDEESK